MTTLCNCALGAVSEQEPSVGSSSTVRVSVVAAPIAELRRELADLFDGLEERLGSAAREAPLVARAAELRRRAETLLARQDEVIAGLEREAAATQERLTRGWEAARQLLPLAADDPLARRHAALVAAASEARRLVAYTTSFAEFLSGATGLPAAALEENLQMHVLGLKAVVDAQAAGDETAHYTTLREAYAHMAMTAEALSGAIAGQQPEMFTGDGMASAAGLRVALNNLLAEHTFLAANATDEALNGNTPGFEAAAAALDENSVELADAITSVYGDEAGAEFLAQWRAHIGFFVDYTTASAAGDEAGQTAAVENLGGYITGFAAFLAGATELPQDALEAGLQEHVMGLAKVVDAQAAEDPTAAYSELRTAYLHMQALGDALAGAIAGQFPEMFPMEGSAEG